MDYKTALATVNKTPGSLVELGFGKGNSLKEFIGYMNDGSIVKRNILIYESFSGYRAPVDEDQNAFKKGEFTRPPQPAFDIIHLINRDVKVQIGYIEETLTKEVSKEPIALVHSHLISYTSTQFALDSIHPKLKVNGAFIISDYDAFPGTKLAVDEFYASNSSDYRLKVNKEFAILTKRQAIKIKPTTERSRSVMT
jgi:hypothetical protein